MRATEVEHETLPDAQAITGQLQRMLASHHFCHSNRYPALLRYLVEQTQQGHGSQLKERTLGIEVFRRAPDYDTTADPVVRVTAAEVRKRIAQYYHEPEHRGELRIDLPTGSYVPRFLPPLPTHEAASHEAPEAARLEPAPLPPASALVLPAPVLPLPQPAPRARWPLRKTLSFLTVFAACVAVLSVLAYNAINRQLEAGREQAIRQFWQPIASSANPMLIVVGHHSMDKEGKTIPAQDAVANVQDQVLLQMNRSSQVTISDLLSLMRIGNFSQHEHLNYHTVGAGAANFSDLRNGPVLLFAGLDNRWTLRFTRSLRFRFRENADDAIGVIEDSQDPTRHWQVDFHLPYSRLPEDYAIVARYTNPMLEQPVIIAAGIGETGTQAASEFITEERFLREVNALTPHDRTYNNMEFVLATPVVDGHPGNPRIVASQFW